MCLLRHHHCLAMDKADDIQRTDYIRSYIMVLWNRMATQIIIPDIGTVECDMEYVLIKTKIGSLKSVKP